MSTRPTKKENLQAIKTRLQVTSLPSKFTALPANAIAIFAEYPELDAAIQVIIEQNNTIKSGNGRRLAAENKAESLQEKLAEFLNMSKSGIIELWHKLFGKASTDDDEVLNEIGVVSNQTYNHTLQETNEQVVEYNQQLEHIHMQLQIAKDLMSSEQMKQMGIEYKKWVQNQSLKKRA